MHQNPLREFKKIPVSVSQKLKQNLSVPRSLLPHKFEAFTNGQTIFIWFHIFPKIYDFDHIVSILSFGTLECVRLNNKSNSNVEIS